MQNVNMLPTFCKRATIGPSMGSGRATCLERVDGITSQDGRSPS